MMLLSKYTLVAVATELASLSLLDGSTSEVKLLGYFALHSVASAIVTLLAWMLLPGHLKTPRWAVLALLFSFDFFIPFLGVVGMVVVLHVAQRFPSVVRAERYAEIEEPKFMPTKKKSANKATCAQATPGAYCATRYN